MPFDTSKVRAVAVVGHASSGKTSLIDGALFMAKAVPTHGRVANGSSAADCSPDEIERKITIHAKPLHCKWQDHQICLLDTPGVADFYGDTMAAIRAADAAIVVVDGVNGVEIGTRRVWKLLDEMQKPRLIFVSKLDKENSDFFRCVEQIRSAFGKNCIPFELPGRQGSGLFEGRQPAHDARSRSAGRVARPIQERPRQPRRSRRGTGRQAAGRISRRTEADGRRNHQGHARRRGPRRDGPDLLRQRRERDRRAPIARRRDRTAAVAGGYAAPCSPRTARTWSRKPTRRSAGLCSR